MNSISTKIKDSRIMHGLTLKELSKLTGITDSRLSRLENGSDTTFWNTLKEFGEILRACKIPPSYALFALGYGEKEIQTASFNSLEEDDKQLIEKLISRLNSSETTKKTVFKLGELFCGPGGLAWGAMHAKIADERFKIVHQWANDFDKDACATYIANIAPSNPESVICDDVKNLNMENLAPIDALAFGFPCNDFSVVGEQKGFEGNYGPLYTYGVKALLKFKPMWFLAENVGGLRSANEGKAFRKILSDFKDSGYKIVPHLYKFEEYGVPQARHRVIIVGIRNDLPFEFKVPSPALYENCNNSAKYAIENPPIPENAFNNEKTKQSDAVIERLKYIKPGQNAFTANLPENLKLNVKGARISQIYKRLDPDKPAYTVTGSGGGGTHIYHWSEPRALTNRERARLQTFPDDFVFKGSKESVRKQIGMAVPCNGAKIVFEAILKTFAGEDYESVPPSIEE